MDEGVARGRSKSTYRQHVSVDLGVYYYQDTATGETVWEVPQGAEVIAEMAEGDEEAEGAEEAGDEGDNAGGGEKTRHEDPVSGESSCVLEYLLGIRRCVFCVFCVFECF